MKVMFATEQIFLNPFLNWSSVVTPQKERKRLVKLTNSMQLSLYSILHRIRPQTESCGPAIMANCSNTPCYNGLDLCLTLVSVSTL